MVTADKSRFNRRRMYLISNEFTLPAFSGARPLLIVEGFISLKRDLRELNIAEIPVEPRVRSNLIPGRARAGRRGSRLSPWLSSLFVPLVSHYPQQFLVFIFRIRSLPYVHVKLRMRPPRKWAAELDDFLVFSSATNYLFRAPRNWQTVVARRATLRENTAKFVQKRGVNGGGVRGRWYKVRTVFRWSSALRLIPLTGAKEYYFSTND